MNPSLSLSTFPYLPRFKSRVWIEIILLLFVGVYFARDLYDLNPELWPKGDEAPLIVALNQVVEQGIRVGDFPLWHRTSGTGIPLLGNSDLSFFNPFVALFTLIFGAVNGMKLALGVSFCFAGFSAWLFAWTMGLGRWGRMWSGALWMLCGSMVNPLDSGIYVLLLGAAWIPMVFAAFVLICKTDWKWARILGVIAMSAFVLSGHVYYQLFVFTALIVMCLVWAIEIHEGNIQIAWKRLLTVVIVLAASAALVAFTLIPQFEFRSLVLYDTQNDYLTLNWQYALLNYVVPNFDYYTSRVLSALGGHPLESYHYIGLMPFVLLIFLFPSFRDRRREIFFLIGLVWVGMMWTDPQNTGGQYVAKVLPIMRWVRMPFRAEILGTLGFILLSAFGLDAVFLKIEEWQSRYSKNFYLIIAEKIKYPLPIGIIAQTLLVLMMIVSVVDLYESSRRFIGLVFRERLPSEAVTWLKNYNKDDNAYFTQFEAAWWQPETYQAEVIWLNSEALLPLRSFASNTGLPLHPEPLYYFTNTAPPPNTEKIYSMGQGAFYRKMDAMPYAFYGDLDTLNNRNPEEFPQLVKAAAAKWINADELKMTVDSIGYERLVAFVQFYPGWEVWIDGKPGRLLRTTEYISVNTLPGTHTYQFIYNPLSVKLGLAISGITLMALLLYIFVPSLWWMRLIPWNKK